MGRNTVLYAGSSLVASKYYWGWNGSAATVSVETTAQPGKDCSARSSHELQVEYQYYEIDSGCMSGCYDWYDAYGYSFSVRPPKAPPLSAILTSASAAISTRWKIHVTYTGHGRSDSDYFPDGSGRLLSSTATWNIQQDFGGNIRGGTATIEWTYGSHPTRYFTFYIRGTNPSESAAKSHLGGNPWFLTRIARHESGLRQFSGSSPFFGPPNGWGLMQLDPPPGPQEIWSWWTNADVGKQRVDQKDSQLAPAWNQRVDDWNDWNAGNPGEEVPPPAPRTEAGCTFTWGGSKSFRDACWIKRYNGAPNGDYLIWDNFTDPDHPAWDYRPENNRGENYVNFVCSQAP